MTPLEEAVARIIDPYAWRVEYGIAMDNSLDKARRILALPEIVNALEVLKQFKLAADYADQFEEKDRALTHAVGYELCARAREAYAALQPLKKEAV